jgi:hypothetical protein
MKTETAIDTLQNFFDTYLRDEASCYHAIRQAAAIYFQSQQTDRDAWKGYYWLGDRNVIDAFTVLYNLNYGMYSHCIFDYQRNAFDDQYWNAHGRRRIFIKDEIRMTTEERDKWIDLFYDNELRRVFMTCVVNYQFRLQGKLKRFSIADLYLGFARKGNKEFDDVLVRELG